MQVSSYRSQFNIFGSVPLSKAKIVCIIHEGSTLHIWEHITEFVNQIWTGHTLLVGSVAKGAAFHPSKSKILRKLKGPATIKGWDIDGLSKIINEFNRIHGLIENFEKRELFELTAGGWYSLLTNDKTEGYLTNFDEFLSFAVPAPQDESSQSKVLSERASLKKELFDYLESGRFEEFRSCLKRMIEMAKRHFNRSCALKQAEISKSRHASLKEALIEELKTNQKVIVCLEKEQLADAEMQAFLMENQSVALCSIWLPPFFPNMEQLWENPEEKPSLIAKSDNCSNHCQQEDSHTAKQIQNELTYLTAPKSVEPSLIRKSPTYHNYSLVELEFTSSN